MNIGIMTFNRAINYGAVLQSYALKHFLLQNGYTCEIINYQNQKIEKGASPFYIKSLAVKDLVIFLVQIKMRLQKNKKFHRFTNQYLDTEKKMLTSNNIEEIKDRFDVLITGSDQVWNYEITGLDPNYFLSFAGKKCKTASYAASFGVSEVPSELREKYQSLLGEVQYLSVREETGKQLVKNLTERVASVHIDPVFLLEKEEWQTLSVSPQIDGEYILVYSINKAGCYTMAEALAKETGLPIVGLQVPTRCKTKCRKIREESPEEFLGWINHGKYVITDSFHGLAFSILLNKQFLFCNGGEGKHRLSRQQTLLKLMGLEKQVGEGVDYQKIYEPIDFKQVNVHIKDARQEAKHYLKMVCK